MNKMFFLNGNKELYVIIKQLLHNFLCSFTVTISKTVMQQLRNNCESSQKLGWIIAVLNIEYFILCILYNFLYKRL